MVQKTVMLTVCVNEALRYAKTNGYYHSRVELVDVSVITQLVRKFFNRIIQFDPLIYEVR